MGFDAVWTKGVQLFGKSTRLTQCCLSQSECPPCMLKFCPANIAIGNRFETLEKLLNVDLRILGLFTLLL